MNGQHSIRQGWKEWGGGEKRDRGTEGCREKERERDQFPHGNKLKMFLMPFSVFPLPKN